MGTNLALFEAVKTQNAKLPPEHAAMTQEKWKAATILDPFVRSFSKNATAEFLKSKKDSVVCEGFLSDADGLKRWLSSARPPAGAPRARGNTRCR